MARKLGLGIAFLALTALVQTLEAQQSHFLLWTIPPGGSLPYQLYASVKRFAVDDVIVFEFVTGIHTVARVTKEAYDSCDSTNPLEIQTIGPANVILESAGENYFLCTIPMHCTLGQKLAINVTGSSPPVPSPSSDRVAYVVGDTLGWRIPPGGASDYAKWVNSKTFTTGDILVFNFETGNHNVARVTKDAYDACNSNNPMELETNGPTNYTLESAGEYYFICGVAGHCSLGQKLSINVTDGTSESMATPIHRPRPLGPLGTSAARDVTVEHVVGDALGWLPRPAGAIAYSEWADNKKFVVGDTLVFNFANGTQDVAMVTRSAYENCDTNNTISLLTRSPARVTLIGSGEYYFTTTYPLLCSLGQHLAINVTTAVTTTTTSASPKGGSTTGGPLLPPPNSGGMPLLLASNSGRPSHANAASYVASVSLVIAVFVI